MRRDVVIDVRYSLVMMNDAMKHDARYAKFAAEMLAAEAVEIARVAALAANPRIVKALQASGVATVRPSK